MRIKQDVTRGVAAAAAAAVLTRGGAFKGEGIQFETMARSALVKIKLN